MQAPALIQIGSSRLDSSGFLARNHATIRIRPTTYLGIVRAMSDQMSLRLTDPELDFWVDLRVRQFGGCWLAVSDLASTPEPSAAGRLDVAILLSLWPLGIPVAQRLTMLACDLLAAP